MFLTSSHPLLSLKPETMQNVQSEHNQGAIREEGMVSQTDMEFAGPQKKIDTQSIFMLI